MEMREHTAPEQRARPECFDKLPKCGIPPDEFDLPPLRSPAGKRSSRRGAACPVLVFANYGTIGISV